MMSDDIDRASEFEEIERAIAVQNVRGRAVTLRPVGSCYFCSEEIPEDRLFCDELCRDDYDLEQLTKRKQGL